MSADRLLSGCRGCKYHLEDFGGENVRCIYGYYKKHPKAVAIEDIVLTPDFCPRKSKKQED